MYLGPITVPRFSETDQESSPAIQRRHLVDGAIAFQPKQKFTPDGTAETGDNGYPAIETSGFF